MFFMNIGPDSERQRENGTKQTIRQTWVGINRCFHFSLLKSTLPNHHTSITRSTVLQIWVISSEHFILSSVPLHHLPPLLYQLMTLPLFFTDKIRTISSQFSPPLTQNFQPHPLLNLPSSPSVPSLRQKYPNLSNSSPAILQHVI